MYCGDSGHFLSLCPQLPRGQAHHGSGGHRWAWQPPHGFTCWAPSRGHNTPYPLKFFWTPVLTTISSASRYLQVLQAPSQRPFLSGRVLRLVSPQTGAKNVLSGDRTKFISCLPQENVAPTTSWPPAQCSACCPHHGPAHPSQALPAPGLSGIRGPGGSHSRSSVQFPVSSDAWKTTQLKNNCGQQWMDVQYP